MTDSGEHPQLDALLNHSDLLRRKSEALAQAFKDLQRRIAQVIDRRASPRSPRGPDRRTIARSLEAADRRKPPRTD